MDSRLGLHLCVPDHRHAAQYRHGIPRRRWYRHRPAHYRLCTRHTIEADGPIRSAAVAGVRCQCGHGNPAADRLSLVALGLLYRIVTDILPVFEVEQKSLTAKANVLAITSLAAWAVLIAAGRFLAYTHKWEMLGVPAVL
jgi:hypothetical protein